MKRYNKPKIALPSERLSHQTTLLKNRVPHIIVLYWIIKIVSTTLGETGADAFSMTLNLGYGETIIIFLIIFLTFFIIKLSLKGYHPWIYWLTFTASAIVGTAISDFIDRTLHLGYAMGSTVLATLLLVTLIMWYKKEKSINVEYITTSTAEIFYWIAFLFANTLGTAAGDFLADNMSLGFMYGAVFLSIILVIIALLHLYTKTSGVLLFWFAFILTRPFGATFGDLLTKPLEKGGLNLGTIGSSVVILLILFFTITKETKLEKEKLTKLKHGQWT